MHIDSPAYATKRVRGLADLRDRQRRQFRAIPSNMFRTLRWDDPLPAVPPEIDSIDLEIYIRTRAAETLSDTAAAYLEKRVNGSAGEWCWNATQALDGQLIKYSRPIVERAVGEEVPEWVDSPGDPVNKSMLAFLMLAVLADRIACDGYADPRVPRTR
jgi:hypothetical protein